MSYQFSFGLVDKFSFKLAVLVLLASLLSNSTYSQQEKNIFKKEIEDLIDHLSKEGKFSGCIVLSDRNSKRVIKKCVGFSNSGGTIKNDLNTKFSLASVGKLFTILAAIQLINDGKLNYEDKLDAFSFSFSDPRANDITIRNLLSHKSGFGHYWDDPEYKKSKTDLYQISDYVNFIEKKILEFNPGTNYKYSNEGFILLGRIIEQVSGQDYYSFVEENIFSPLNMKDTGFPSFSELDSTFAEPLTKTENGENVTFSEIMSVRGASDGGGYSTIGDMSEFINSIFNERFIDTTSLSLLISNFEDEKLETERAVFDFIGASPGVSATVGYHGPTGLNVVVLSNYDSPASETVVMGILEKIMKP